MPSLLQALQSHDLGHLRIIADLWGIELQASETEAALQELVNALLAPGAVEEMVGTLPAEARAALEALREFGGRIPWATFSRQFGEVRAVGPARRDRERIHLHPTSAAEVLFYRALLARAFFDTPTGIQEFAYLADEWLERLSPPPPGLPVRGEIPKKEVLGRPATSLERAHPLPHFDYLLDDMTTLLAALRLGLEPPPLSTPPEVVSTFARLLNLLDDHQPQPEAIGEFLKIPRHQALNKLVEAWKNGQKFNELRLIPNLICEGEWQNDPLLARQAILGFLTALPKGTWWSLSSFIQSIKEVQPDFQRPVGDYDSWFIRRASDGKYLRGFEHWEEVDGALIAYLIGGPLYWLGLVELAIPTDTATVTAFRLLEKPAPPSPEEAKLHVSSHGLLTIPRLVPRAARYQISRFCEWLDFSKEEYRYQVTVESLERARAQGLKAGHLLTLLARHAATEIPPAFVKAVKRWEQNGCEARIETLSVLRVRTPEVLKALRRSRAARFLGEALGPQAVIIKKDTRAHLLKALAELGFLVKSEEDERIVPSREKEK